MYAKRTTVPVAQSQAEITECLRAAGASEVGTGWSMREAFLAFRIGQRNVKLLVPMPSEDELARTPSGKRRSEAQRTSAHEQVQRQRWRALALIVRAKLEAIELGATTLEREFLADLMLPTGRTFSEQIGHELTRVLDSGSMPPLLRAAVA